MSASSLHKFMYQYCTFINVGSQTSLIIVLSCYGEPSKLKAPKLGKSFQQRGGHRKLKKFPSFSWENFKNRGVITFQKSPNFPKVHKFEK